MALIKIERFSPDVMLGLWKIEEDEVQFKQLVSSCIWERVLSGSQSIARRREKLAVYSLLSLMTGDKELLITHQATGRPIVDGWNIAISHTRGFAAVILSKQLKVAVDIEYMSTRVNRIAEKFIREDEYAPETLGRLIIWCAKETMYKFYYEENLQYFDMRVADRLIDEELSKVSDEEICKGVIYNMKRNIPLTFDYQITKDYILTWSMG